MKPNSMHRCTPEGLHVKQLDIVIVGCAVCSFLFPPPPNSPFFPLLVKISQKEAVPEIGRFILRSSRRADKQERGGRNEKKKQKTNQTS